MGTEPGTAAWASVPPRSVRSALAADAGLSRTPRAGGTRSTGQRVQHGSVTRVAASAGHRLHAVRRPSSCRRPGHSEKTATPSRTQGVCAQGPEDTGDWVPLAAWKLRLLVPVNSYWPGKLLSGSGRRPVGRAQGRGPHAVLGKPLRSVCGHRCLCPRARPPDWRPARRPGLDRGPGRPVAAPLPAFGPLHRTSQDFRSRRQHMASGCRAAKSTSLRPVQETPWVPRSPHGDGRRIRERRGPQLHTHATQRALCPEPPSWDAAGPELRVRTRARPTCRPWRRGGAPRGAGVRVWAPSRVVSDTGTPPHAARDPQVPLQKPLEGAGLRPARASRACLLRIVLTGALGSRCSGRHLRPLGRVSHEDGKSVGPPGCGARRAGAAPGQAQARVPAPHPQWGRDQRHHTPASALEPSCSAAQARPPQATLAGRRDPRGVGRWPRAARRRHPSSYSQLE